MSQFPFNDVNKAKMIEVCDALFGTCNSLDNALEAVFGQDINISDFDTELLRELDDYTMECQECSWWCEPGFLNDNQVCENCCPNDEDEE